MTLVVRHQVLRHIPIAKTAHAATGVLLFVLWVNWAQFTDAKTAAEWIAAYPGNLNVPDGSHRAYINIHGKPHPYDRGTRHDRPMLYAISTAALLSDLGFFLWLSIRIYRRPTSDA